MSLFSVWKIKTCHCTGKPFTSSWVHMTFFRSIRAKPGYSLSLFRCSHRRLLRECSQRILFRPFDRCVRFWALTTQVVDSKMIYFITYPIRYHANSCWHRGVTTQPGFLCFVIIQFWRVGEFLTGFFSQTLFLLINPEKIVYTNTWPHRHTFRRPAIQLQKTWFNLRKRTTPAETLAIIALSVKKQVR